MEGPPSRTARQARQSASFGDTVTFTITPDPGYRVLDVLVDSVSVGTPATYDFFDVDADHTIEASFALDQFTITATVV